MAQSSQDSPQFSARWFFGIAGLPLLIAFGLSCHGFLASVKHEAAEVDFVRQNSKLGMTVERLLENDEIFIMEYDRKEWLWGLGSETDVPPISPDTQKVYTYGNFRMDYDRYMYVNADGIITVAYEYENDGYILDESTPVMNQ